MDGYLDTEKVEAWLDGSKHPEIRRVRQKVIDNITFIDEKTFNKAIENATRKFIRKINKRDFWFFKNKDTKKYIILWDREFYKSKRWVYYKVKNLLPLTNIETHYYYGRPWLKENLSEDIENIIIFDDAIFSGANFGEIINDLGLYTKKKINVFIIVGYLTKGSLEILRSTAKNRKINLNIYFQKKINTINEILNSKEVEIFGEKSLSLTYFSHNIPDFLSFSQYISQLMNPYQKPYSKNTPYGVEEKKEWEAFLKNSR